MKEIDLTQVKDIQMNMLIFIDNFCNRHKISYYLAYGTLLGAKRHSGYIPWDDDIDIMMLREDYLRFISLLEKENDPVYGIIHLGNDKSYSLTFAKVVNKHTVLIDDTVRYWKGTQGISIDVFPYDEAYDDSLTVIKKGIISFLLKVINAKVTSSYSDHKNNKFKIYFLKLISLPLPAHFLASICEFLSTNFHVRKGNFLCCFSTIATEMPFIDKEWMKETTISFEGNLLKCPVGIDEWLKANYGDYMKLPPIEKRVSGHSYKAYLK